MPQLAVRSVAAWQMPPMGAHLPGPRSVAIGLRDEVVVLDNGGRVLVFSPEGELRREWMMPEYDVGRPEGAAVTRDGRIVVCDTHYHRVVVFDADGDLLHTFGGHGKGEGQFIYPVAVAADATDHLYIGEYGGNDRIQVFTTAGTFLRQFGAFGTAPGEFQRPSGIAWHDGEVFVADAINNRVQKFTDQGVFLGIITRPDAGLQFPYDITRAPDGSLFVVEYGAGRVTRMNRDGEVLGCFGSSGRGPDQMVTPWGIAADSKGRLRIADTGNRRMLAVDPGAQGK